MNKFLIKENYSSINLFEKINILNEEDIRNIEKGLNWVVNNAPNAVLVGGTATVHYITGARDLTPDLDFMVNDVESIKTKLSYDDIRFSELNPGYEEPLGITVEEFNTDFLDKNTQNTKLNELILRTPVVGKVGGHDVKIINPELLAIMKFDVGRKKDLEDALKILGSGKIDKNKYVEYLRILKPTLDDYESMYSYRTFIQ